MRKRTPKGALFFFALSSFSLTRAPAFSINETIKLPVDANDEPDWAYMEQYMTKIMAEEETKANELIQNK